MQDILSQIVADKVVEVARAQESLPAEELRARALASPAPSRSFSGALAASQSGIIAEFKRRSPSKGWIHENVKPQQVVPLYAAGGAAALSILTDGKYFGGELDFIRQMRPLVDIPILRKDFIISEYQLLEAREAGADAVLLIAACLSLEECCRLAACAHSLGLEVLLEVHSAAELPYLQAKPDAVGVNNRNLGTFHTDVQNSFNILEELKAAARQSGVSVLVSESGISSPDTVKRLREVGYRGFLMGENFMKHADPGAALSAFVKELSI